MTEKQPEALRIAAEFESFAIDHAPNEWPAIQQRDLTNASITLRAQHAAIERKDALLRQALETWDTVCNAFGWDKDHMAAFATIRKELSQ